MSIDTGRVGLHSHLYIHSIISCQQVQKILSFTFTFCDDNRHVKMKKRAQWGMQLTLDASIKLSLNWSRPGMDMYYILKHWNLFFLEWNSSGWTKLYKLIWELREQHLKHYNRRPALLKCCIIAVPLKVISNAITVHLKVYNVKLKHKTFSIFSWLSPQIKGGWEDRVLDKPGFSLHLVFNV